MCSFGFVLLRWREGRKGREEEWFVHQLVRAMDDPWMNSLE